MFREVHGEQDDLTPAGSVVDQLGIKLLMEDGELPVYGLLGLVVVGPDGLERVTLAMSEGMGMVAQRGLSEIMRDWVAHGMQLGE